MNKMLVAMIVVIGLGCEVASAKGRDKTLAIGVNPLGFLVGIGNAYIDLAVSSKFTIGVEGQILEDDSSSILSGIDQEGNAYGARLRYFFNSALDDSWVITAFGGMAKSDITITQTIPTVATDRYTADGSYLGAMIGYHWQWSYFFMHLGGGYVSYNLDMEAEGPTSILTLQEAPLDGGGLAIDFSLGFAF